MHCANDGDEEVLEERGGARREIHQEPFEDTELVRRAGKRVAHANHANGDGLERLKADCQAVRLQ